MSGGDITVITQAVVNVFVSSRANTFRSERRFPKSLTIAELKHKLELLTGASPAGMKLEVYNTDDKLVCHLDNDLALLGSYPIDDGMRIHVLDPSVQAGEFEDVSKVKKYEISEDSYNQRTDSVRAFKQKLGVIDGQSDQGARKDDEQAKVEEKLLYDQLKDKVGQRCETTVPKQPTRRGTLMFAGLCDFKPGYWIGVRYDEPLGKNDGSVAGKRYFECPPNYGGFVKPQHVNVGDYPEEGMDEM